MESRDVTSASFTLPSGAELCIAVPSGEQRNSSSVRVVESPGMAESRVESLGAPLTANIRYFLTPGVNYVIYAWSPATLTVEGSSLLLRSVYKSSSPSMARALAEYHCVVHSCRMDAEREEGRTGPLVLICGASGVGKRAAARTLCNYATRTGWSPLFVDIDCSARQSLSIPGSVAAAAVEVPTAFDEDLTVSHIGISFFAGASEPQYVQDDECPMRAPFVHAVDKLMDVVAARLEAHRSNVIGRSGAIIVAPDLRRHEGMQFLKGFIDRNHVSLVVCIGDDSLFHLLHMKYHTQVEGGRRLPEGGPYLTEGGTWLRIDRLAPSPSAVPTLLTRQPTAVVSKLENYFFGCGALSIQPLELTRSYATIDVLQLAEREHRAVLVTVDQSQLEYVVGCVGALFDPVVAARSEKGILGSAPFGYARIQTVGATELTFLTTVHGAVPAGKLSLVVGSMRWLTG